jgi:DNA-binding transcriptional LysR family regulator
MGRANRGAQRSVHAPANRDTPMQRRGGHAERGRQALAANGLNWDDVRCFLALARNPRLREAANTLGIDPTTLNRRIRRLGQATNATLFKQFDMHWNLTRSGEAFLPFAEKAEVAMLDMEEARFDGSLSGLIRVAVPEPFSAWFLSDHIEQFNHAYPDISVELISPSFHFSLLKREVDIGILPRQPSVGPLTVRKLLDYTVRAYASESYLRGHEPIRNLDDLRHHKIIGYVPELLPGEELDFWRDLVPGLGSKIRTTGIHMQARAIASGAGLGLLPTYVAAEETRLVPILREAIRIEQSLWLVVREDVRHNQRISAFVDWLNAVVASDRHFFADIEAS